MAYPHGLALGALLAALVVALAGAQQCPSVSDDVVQGLAEGCAAAEDVCGDACLGKISEAFIDNLPAVPCADVADDPEGLASRVDVGNCARPYVGTFLSAGVDVQALAACDIDAEQAVRANCGKVKCSDGEDACALLDGAGADAGAIGAVTEKAQASLASLTGDD